MLKRTGSSAEKETSNLDHIPAKGRDYTKVNTQRNMKIKMIAQTSYAVYKSLNHHRHKAESDDPPKLFRHCVNVATQLMTGHKVLQETSQSGDKETYPQCFVLVKLLASVMIQEVDISLWKGAGLQDPTVSKL